MAPQSNGKSKTQGKKRTSSGAAKRPAATKTAPAGRNQAQVAVEAAVDLPVGVVLTVTDRLSELVEPWSGRGTAEKQVKAYRTQFRRSLKRVERRGATARRKATAEAKKTRTRVEREARKRQRTVETTLRRNRDQVEQRVRRAIDEQTTRAQDLVDQVTEQLSALR